MTALPDVDGVPLLVDKRYGQRGTHFSFGEKPSLEELCMLYLYLT